MVDFHADLDRMRRRGWRDYFLEILDIRNGAAPRPAEYFRVYWDFVVDGGQRPRAGAQAVSFDDLARQAGFTDAEFTLLRQSEENSNLLAELEARALQAQTPAELEQARQTLHGPEYHREKARIMQPLDNLLSATADRANQTQDKRRSAGQTLTLSIMILLALSGLLSAAGLVVAVKSRGQG